MADNQLLNDFLDEWDQDIGFESAIQLWLQHRDSLDERDESVTLKWIESQKANRDIGFKEAIQRWLQHRPQWRAAHSLERPWCSAFSHGGRSRILTLVLGLR